MRAANTYDDIMRSLTKRKEWSVKVLRGQQDQIETVFLDLKMRMEMEFKHGGEQIAQTIRMQERESTREKGRFGANVLAPNTREIVETTVGNMQDSQTLHVRHYERNANLPYLSKYEGVHDGGHGRDDGL